MPIKIPNELPATKTLLEENIFVITETRALTQDIRPLKIDRKSTRLNSSHRSLSRMPSSA